MKKLDDALCNEILSIIEIQEAKLLNWGFISGSTDLRLELQKYLSGNIPDDIKEKWSLAKQEGITADDVIDSLEERRLIFQLPDGTYRTRFSETIRLLYLLRQRFSDDD